MDDYESQRRKMEKSIKDLEIVSNFKVKEEPRAILGEILIKKMVLTSKSIMKLLPKGEKSEYWDFSSIATLIRNVIENYNIFFYLSIESIESDEVYFRIQLCEMHSEVERLKMYFSLKVNEETIQKQKSTIEELKSEIRENSFFKGLDREKQYQLLKGNRSFYLSHRDITQRHNMDVKNEDIDFIYRYISNFLHTSPFSLANNRNEKPEGIVELMFLMTKYIDQAKKDYKKLLQA